MRAIIADDEPLLRHHLGKALTDLWPELSIVASVSNGREALEQIQAQQPDVIFLDIRMPEMDGVALARRIYEDHSDTHIVFTTAYDQHALDAFETNAVDYLLKPITSRRLQETIERLKSRVTTKETQDPDVMTDVLKALMPVNKPEPLRWVRAAKGDDIHLVAVGDVLYFKAEDKYVSVFTKKGESVQEYVIRTPLRELLSQLDEQQFWQIHRSVVVNIALVEKVKKDFRGKLHIEIAGKSLPVSRAAQPLFKAM
uniref:LytR/AlgR family response regulator transcription factor n=1 Tax=Thaumasiovibrio occultus TaxID=1891184 RepID=UPI000B3558C3|nr:LytTR family DNA-binding domain-containing protein [Thaumasiovibrio occultus]